MRRIAISLLSGGLDSCVASTWAKRQGYELYLLSVNYGQVMRRELDHALRIGRFLEPIEHKVLVMEGFGQMSRSSRTHAELIEYDRSLDESTVDIPAAYPPGRDASFILIASAWLESLMLEDIEHVESGRIIIGTNKHDATTFPDCRPEVYGLLNELLAVSTKVSVQYGKQMKVETPLIELTKADIVRLGLELNAPLQHTWSCYEGKELACGRCDACKLRLWAFEQAGIPDPIPYAEAEALTVSDSG
jgi:7-cyano-7-deazaguanine synthase